MVVPRAQKEEQRPRGRPCRRSPGRHPAAVKRFQALKVVQFHVPEVHAQEVEFSPSWLQELVVTWQGWGGGDGGTLFRFCSSSRKLGKLVLGLENQEFSARR